MLSQVGAQRRRHSFETACGRKVTKRWIYGTDDWDSLNMDLNLKCPGRDWPGCQGSDPGPDPRGIEGQGLFPAFPGGTHPGS